MAAGQNVEFLVSHVGGHLPGAATHQAEGIEVEGFENVRPATRNEMFILGADLEWEYQIPEVSPDSRRAELSEGSETLISEPRDGSPDPEINPQDHNQNPHHGPPHPIHGEFRFDGGSPTQGPNPTRTPPQVRGPFRRDYSNSSASHLSESQNLAHNPPPQNQDQPPYQNQEAGPDPGPTMTTARKVKAFLETNIYFNLAAISIIAPGIAAVVGVEKRSLSTGAIVGSCIWIPLLVTCAFLPLVWRSKEKMQERQRNQRVEAAAAAEGRAFDPGAMA